MAISLTASELVTSNVGGAILTTAGFTPATGDIIVVKAGTSNVANTYGTPSNSANTITWTKRVENTTSTWGYQVLWTGLVTAGGTAMTVSMTPSNASYNAHAMMVEDWAGAQVAATPATVNATGNPGAPLGTLTTVAANSVVSWWNVDKTGASPTGFTYNTSSATPTNEGTYNPSSAATFYAAYQTAAAAGAQTLGISSPSAQKWCLTGVEIQAAASTPTVTGSVAVSAGLTGAVAVLATATGSLALGVALTGAVVPVAVATGTLPVVAGLTGSASTMSTVTGSLPAAAGLTGTASVVGSYVVNGSLPLTVTLTGTAQTIRTVTGALPVTAGLTGTASIPTVPVLAGTLAAALSLSGAANIVALATGTLPLTLGLTGTGVNPSTEHDVTVTASLDGGAWAGTLTNQPRASTLTPRLWAATSTTQARTAVLDTQGWGARLE